MRHTTLFTLLVAAFMSIALFYLKYEVSSLESELSFLNRAITDDREAIHVLKAEWSHLNDSYRLRDLAARHLKMAPTLPEQIVTADGLPEAPADGGGAGKKAREGGGDAKGEKSP